MNATLSRRRAAADPTDAADAGVSLVEVVMAVLMLGAAVVTIVGAFGTLVISSDRSTAHSDVAATIAAAAESIGDSARNPYVNCATAAVYNPAAGIEVPATIGDGNVTITQVRYWDGVAFGDTCFDVDNPLFRLQQVTIKVISVNKRVDQTLTVLKRG